MGAKGKFELKKKKEKNRSKNEELGEDGIKWGERGRGGIKVRLFFFLVRNGQG